MTSPESQNYIVLCPKKNNSLKPQDNDFKIRIMSMFRNLREDMYKCLMKTVKMQTESWIK